MATLTLTFTDPSPVPYGGYIVKYRKIGTTAYTTLTPNPISSPINISGIETGAGYEGTVQSDCGNSVSSPSVSFVAYGSTEIYTMLSNSSTGICTAPVTSVYLASTGDVTSGTTVYSDQALTVPVAGYVYIMNQSGNIFNLSGGVVGTDTGLTCNSGA